jgi:quercetin dioxygenase-like cupin family protein
MRTFHMTKSRGAAVGAALIGAAVVGVGVLPSVAQSPPTFTPEPQTQRALFTDDVDLKLKVKLDGEERVVVNAKDPSRTAVVKFTVDPGAQFPWHTHPGPVIVNITQGELVYVGADDCVERSYPAGTAFVDPGHGHVHTAFNPSTTTPTVFYATFFEAPPPPTSLLIAAPEPEDCEV